MKKTIAFSIIAIFLLSLIPVFADSDSNLRLRTNADVRINKSDNEIKADAKARAEVRAQSREAFKERLKVLKEEYKAKIEALGDEKAEVFANLSSDRLQKIAELDKRQIEKLSGLNVRNLEKIAALKGERLERLAELEKDKLERLANLNESDLDIASNLSRARLKEIAKLDNTRLRTELKAIHFVKIKNADELNSRNVTQAELAKSRERFESAKEKFKNAKDELNDERKALKEARDNKNENATLEHAKNYLLKFSDALINHLEKLKAKVQENKNIDADAEAKIVAEIDAQIADITKIKAEVQAAATKEQVKGAAKNLREKWNTLKHIIDLHAKRIVAARVEGVINKGLVLEKKLDNVLTKAKEKGIEINSSAEMSLFSDKIALSRDKYEQAQAKFSEVIGLRAKNESADSDKIKVLMSEADQLLKESRDALKEAHDVLKIIVKKIKDAYPQADISADAEVEVEQEAQASA